MANIRKIVWYWLIRLSIFTAFPVKHESVPSSYHGEEGANITIDCIGILNKKSDPQFISVNISINCSDIYWSNSASTIYIKNSTRYSGGTTLSPALTIYGLNMADEDYYTCNCVGDIFTGIPVELLGISMMHLLLITLMSSIPLSGSGNDAKDYVEMVVGIIGAVTGIVALIIPPFVCKKCACKREIRQENTTDRSKIGGISTSQNTKNHILPLEMTATDLAELRRQRRKREKRKRKKRRRKNLANKEQSKIVHV